jgi:hypothetical protein
MPQEAGTAASRILTPATAPGTSGGHDPDDG